MPLTPALSPDDIAQSAAQMDRCVPALAARSSVMLVQLNGEVLRQVGSGTLLAVAEHSFVVTAAHVARSAIKDGRALGVSGSIDKRFVPGVGGRWIGSHEDESHKDPLDVAVYEFTPEQSSRFSGDSFVRIGDASFEQDLSRKFFVVTGFPGMWSESGAADAGPMNSQLLQYGTYALQGDTVGLTDFDPRRHILLDAKPENTVDRSGRPVSFRTRSGFLAQMPGDLGGVSGSSVWSIGDLRIPFNDWSPKQSRLVGIQTSVYARRGAIKATRWNAVTSLLYQAFPSLRSSIQMYERMGHG